MLDWYKPDLVSPLFRGRSRPNQHQVVDCSPNVKFLRNNDESRARLSLYKSGEARRHGPAVMRHHNPTRSGRDKKDFGVRPADNIPLWRSFGSQWRVPADEDRR